MTKQEEEYQKANHNEEDALEYAETNSNESDNLNYAVANGAIDPADVGDVEISATAPKKHGAKKHAPSAAAQKAAKDAEKATGTATTTTPPQPTATAPTKDLAGAIDNAVAGKVEATKTTAAPTVADAAAVSEIPGTAQTGKAPLGHPTRS